MNSRSWFYKSNVLFLQIDIYCALLQSSSKHLIECQNQFTQIGKACANNIVPDLALNPDRLHEVNTGQLMWVFTILRIEYIIRSMSVHSESDK